MQQFFIRHTEVLDIPDESLDCLFVNCIIAIHFPQRRFYPEADFESLDPEDYRTPAAKQSMIVLNRLADEGGYVWAQYRQRDSRGRYGNRVRVKVGIVAPQRIVLRRTRWRSMDREAVLKTLKMNSAGELDPHDGIDLRRIRPHAGTIKRWPASSTKLKLVVEKHGSLPVGPETECLKRLFR